MAKSTKSGTTTSKAKSPAPSASAKPAETKATTEAKAADAAVETKAADVSKTEVPKVERTAVKQPEPKAEAKPEPAKAEPAPQADKADTAKAGTKDAPKEKAPEPAPAARKADTKADEKPQKQKSGFLGTVVGGMIAAALGFGAAYYYFDSRSSEGETALQSSLSDLQSEVSALQEQTTASANEVSTKLDAVESQTQEIATTISAAQEAITDQETRLAELEAMIRTPLEGETSENAMAEMAALRQELTNQKAQLDELMAQTNAELDAARQQAEALQNDTIQAARTNAERAARFEIASALETGAPFRDALTELEAATEAPAPEGLEAYADTGVPLMGDLMAEFPDYARSSLAAARDAGVSGEDLDGFSGFLKSQFNARSTEDTDGDDVNAVLARAEQALRDGDLNIALVEVRSLPEAAAAPLQPWIEAAERRQKALDALETITAN